MSSTTPNIAESVRELTDEIRKASRTAGFAYLDASDGVLEAIVDYQTELQADVDQKWLADVLGAQAEFTRQLLKLNAAQRERLS
jgi:hypothetical protein